LDKRHISTWISTRLINPPVKAAAHAGVPLPGIVILETTGRRSGRVRRTPVGKAIEGDTLWVVAEHGRKAAWVRNVEANPRLRVRVGRRWHDATATVLPEDDPRERQRQMPNRFNSAVVRVMQSDMLTVRIDLDPADRRGAPAP
jgi:deazaflavin-dependent oxidoreductase (nitroreductase family)